MVKAVVVNKQGAKEEFNKPCFGFMSYIDKWEETDDWDDDEDEYICTELAGFESGNLSEMIFYPNMGQRLTGDSLKGFHNKTAHKIHEAMERLPQFFSSVEIQKHGETFAYSFNLEDTNMQTTIVGAMMLRNMMHMSNMREVFTLLIENDVDTVISFFVANMMSRGYNFSEKRSLSSPVHGGDEAIFSPICTINDFKNIYNGGLGYVYQGNWGDTCNGYGRYGEYDGCLAPDFEEAKRRAILIDIMVRNVEDHTDTIEQIENDFCTSLRFTDKELVSFAKMLQEKITEKK